MLQSSSQIYIGKYLIEFHTLIIYFMNPWVWKFWKFVRFYAEIFDSYEIPITVSGAVIKLKCKPKRKHLKFRFIFCELVKLKPINSFDKPHYRYNKLFWKVIDDYFFCRAQDTPVRKPRYRVVTLKLLFHLTITAEHYTRCF